MVYPKPRSPRVLASAVVLTLLASWVVPAAEGADAGRLQFNRDIRPILSENCFHCHGPDKERREAELRLDDRTAAIEALALVPGNADESELIRRVFAEDPEDRMPPVDSHRTLNPTQKALLKQWINEGAEYQPHWAYVAPTRPAVPQVQTRGAVATPIDAFVVAQLERENLKPAREADRRTLIRRLSLDLTGLPPDPRDVESFVSSRDPDAYRKLVRQYLASPHYGERMALPWLDLVRFADTIGFHNDVPIRVWPYRDYVINAFNQNLPFDQFTREQLAGDLLPGSTITQRVASGYNRIHRISGEGGIQDKEYFAKYSADRVRTTATVWLGSTLACAECHDHKFDPFTLKDFYRFAAIFADLKEKGAYNLSGGFTRENLTEETIVETPEQQRQLDHFEAEVTRLAAELKEVKDDALAAGRRAWEQATLASAAAGTLAWKVQRPLVAKSEAGTPLSIEAEDNSVVAGGRNPRHETYVVTIPAGVQRITAVRLEAVTDARFPGDDVARSGAAYFLSEVSLSGRTAGAADEQALRVSAVRGNAATEPGFPLEAVIDDNPQTALSFVRKRGGALALHLAEPWTGGPDSTLTLRIRHSDLHPFQHLGRFRIAVHTETAPDAHPDNVPDAVLKALKVAPEKRTAAQKREIVAYYRLIAPELNALREQHDAAVRGRDALVAALPSMPVSRSVEPRTIRVLPRGNWMDDSGEIVEPGVPEFLGRIKPASGERVSRLDLADWLVSPENPLTARTFVNRLWRQFFGEGLTRTLEDLGSQGEWPTHPDLLDWLAVEFRESGWNVKHLVELIVLSRTYRQASEAPPEVINRDPENRWLARQTRFRLDAELIRDNALAISGLLVRKLGGPSAKPYQPEGYYAPLNFPRREYVADTGEQLYRRGVYTHWQRTFLHPSLMAFDAPSRDECTANRSTSNTPLQALVLLNDPTYVEAARVLAERILREGGRSVRSRVAWAFERALARPPSRQELAALEDLHRQQRTRYMKDEESARALISTGESPVPADLPLAEMAAWTAVSRVVLNLHETISRR